MSKDMSVRYWVAKYVEDPIRNEPRNVGVIVEGFDGFAARFATEREDLTIDRRRLGQRFRFPDVYLQWIEFWREQINAEKIEEIVRATSENYFVVYGGEVSDTGQDTATVVCAFLYNLLVSDASVMQAFEVGTESDIERELSLDVSSALADWSLLADGPTLHVRHPIRRKQAIQGAHAVHRPSFSQHNGLLYLFEAIDFTGKKPKLLQERAGYMAYMFSDIRHAQSNAGGVEAFSIVRPQTEEDGEAIEYAKELLDAESHIVNWADKKDRDRFLRDRQRVAEAVA
jgi:hypothetical protein